jgi:hypothetical protein
MYEDNIEEVDRWLESLEDVLPFMVTTALEQTGAQAIDFARSETSELAPPVGTRRVLRGPKGAKREAMYIPPRGRREGPRRKHPGGWADDTGILALSFFAITGRASRSQYVLVVGNTQPYATHLERKGYWVIRGLFEGFIQQKAHENVTRALRSL